MQPSAALGFPGPDSEERNPATAFYLVLSSLYCFNKRAVGLKRRLIIKQTNYKSWEKIQVCSSFCFPILPYTVIFNILCKKNITKYLIVIYSTIGENHVFMEGMEGSRMEGIICLLIKFI